MKYVEIYQLKDDGKQHVILTCTLEGEVVKFSGDEGLAELMTQEGILDYSKPGFVRLYPNNGGLGFLEQLANNFRSGYLMASEIKE